MTRTLDHGSRNWGRLARRAVRWGAFYTFLLSACVASIAWSQEEEELEAVGLRGIFPFEVPVDLGIEEFERLATAAETWKTWSEETFDAVQQLFEGENLDIPGQQAALATLRRKMTTMETALADPQYRSIHDLLLTLYGRLSRRVALAEAVLDTLTLDPEAARHARLEKAGKDIISALEQLDSHLQTIVGGPAWMVYVDAAELEEIAVAGSSSPSASSTLGRVHNKLTNTQNYGEEQREFLARPQFVSLAQAIEAYQSIATEEPAPVDSEALREQLAALVEALEEYELTNSRTAAADARAARAAIGEQALDRGVLIDRALRTNYFNYNLRVVAAEDFLNRLISEVRRQDQRVRDNVLGASVYGSATTNVELGVDLKPSRGAARFDVTLNGVSRSSTAGVTSQATIYTQGQHYIHGRKEVVYDGERFLTRPATVSVDANNYTTGASTGLSGFPILGSIAESIAVGEAQKRRYQSEAIAAQKVRDETLPRFDSEVDAKFAQANDELETQVRDPLRRNQLFPDAETLLTTDSQLRYNSRLMYEDELGGGGPVALPSFPNAPFVMHAHESLLNNAVDRMNIAGRTMTDKEVVAEVERFMSDLLQRDFRLNDEDEPDDDTETGPDTFVFDEVDPIRIQIEDGRLFLVIRAGFKQEGGDDIPPQEVTVPMSFSVDNGQVIIDRDNVRVSPLQRPESVAVQVARAGAIRNKIESSLPPRTMDGHINFKRDDLPDVIVTILGIKALNGWISVAAQ